MYEIKNRFSFLALLIITFVFVYERNAYKSHDPSMPVKVTTWDALGYYLYLPAIFIYHDIRNLTFYDSIEKSYRFQGEENNFYQFQKNESGYYSGKYLIGVAVLQMPFFIIAHSIAFLKEEDDGFSLIYQKGIAYGALLWVFVSLIFFRKFLLNYYSDFIVGIGLLLGLLATNAVQYIAVEGGQSHAWILPLYVYILVLSASWHRKKTVLKSLGLGIIVGLSIICRPTEGIMLLIPLLWGFKRNAFISFIKENRLHFFIACFGMLFMISPQLCYWKYSTGHWIFDVGSKWDFLFPHFRVLLGEEKGWLIYTPICWLFIIGLFYIGNEKFSLSVKTFMILNIWIIIAWHIWRYGGSYSSRALVQSIPVMMLPMLAIIKQMVLSKWRIVWYLFFIYFLSLNLFQIYQYNNGILHYDRNTWEYYKRIYWRTTVSEDDKKYLQTDTKM